MNFAPLLVSASLVVAAGVGQSVHAAPRILICTLTLENESFWRDKLSDIGREIFQIDMDTSTVQYKPMSGQVATAFNVRIGDFGVEFEQKYPMISDRLHKWQVSRQVRISRVDGTLRAYPIYRDDAGEVASIDSVKQWRTDAKLGVWAAMIPEPESGKCEPDKRQF